CPLYPRKRTLSDRLGMSALCQKRTNEPQQSVYKFHVSRCVVDATRAKRLPQIFIKRLVCVSPKNLGSGQSRGIAHAFRASTHIVRWSGCCRRAPFAIGG